MGYAYNTRVLSSGFVRARDGAIITYDAPGAGGNANQGTLATGINAAGAIVGYYLDATNAFHGFVLAP